MHTLEAACLQGLSSALYQRGEFERALEVGERSSAGLRPFNHRVNAMLTEIALAIPDPEYALDKGKSTFAAAKTRNDVRLAAQVAWPLRLAASMCGDEGFAEALGWEVLELGASTGNSHAQAIGHNMIGWYAVVAGDHDLAALHGELAVKLSPANTEIEIQARHTLAEHLRSVGKRSEAWRLANEAANLPSFATAPATAHMAILVVLALLLLDKGEPAKAAILAGAFPETYHTRHGIGRLLSRQVEFEEEVLSRAREALGTERYVELSAIGRALGPAGAIARLEDGEAVPLDYVQEP
jgi:tetratricopeptide (TPR) repeat protein